MTAPSQATEASDSMEATICAIFGRELGVAPELVAQAASLSETPGLESLRLLRAMTSVEKHFGTEFPDEVVFSVKSISELAAIVRAQLANGHATDGR